MIGKEHNFYDVTKQKLSETFFNHKYWKQKCVRIEANQTMHQQPFLVVNTHANKKKLGSGTRA